jgi:hypothetical protein
VAIPETPAPENRIGKVTDSRPRKFKTDCLVVTLINTVHQIMTALKTTERVERFTVVMKAG